MRVNTKKYAGNKKGKKHHVPRQRFGTPEKLRALGTSTSMCQLARAVGVTVPHMSRIFNNKRTPSLTTAAKMAAYLGISIDRLYVVLSTGTVRPAVDAADVPETLEDQIVDPHPDIPY